MVAVHLCTIWATHEIYFSFLLQHRYADIVQWYTDLAEKFPDNSKFVSSIGKSYEGRDQPAFHFTADIKDVPDKKIYFQCQIHASKNLAAVKYTKILIRIIIAINTGITVMCIILFIPLCNIVIYTTKY